MRSLLLALSIGAAYAFLRGWPQALSPLLRVCAAVLVAGLALAVWSRRPAPDTPKTSARRRPGWLDIAVSTLALLSVEAGFVVFLAAAPPRVELAALELDGVIRPRGRQARAADDPNSTVVAGNWLWHRPGTRKLPRRANFRPGNRPEAFLRTRNRNDATLLLSSRVYLSAFALEHYQYAEWSNPATAARVLDPDPAGFIRFADRPGRQIVHEMFHAADPSGETPLIALQGVVGAQLPSLRELGDGLRILPRLTNSEGHQYLAVSKPLLLEELPADASRASGETAAHLLVLPETSNMAPKLRSLAAAAAGTGSDVERLIRIRDHLRSSLSYSLKITNQRNLDPLENFLFEEQRGPCELFATAGAMFARAIGVPARIAYGWSGGRYYETPNLFVFRTKEAHAWTEVLIDDYGWVILDPTPPDAANAPAASVAGPGESLPGDDSAYLDQDDDLAGSDALSLRTALLLLASLLLPGLAFALARTLRSRHHQATESAAAPIAIRPPGYLAAFFNASARAGHPAPPGRTLRQHLGILADTAPGFAQDLIDYHYSTRYESARPDLATERRLLNAIRRWAWENSKLQTPNSKSE